MPKPARCKKSLCFQASSRLIVLHLYKIIAMEIGPTVISSPADHRVYRAITLPNGLRALLIHDPQIVLDGGENVANGAAGHHGELKEDPAYMSGSDGDESESGSEPSGSDSGSEDGSESGSEGSEDEQHVRPHKPRSAHPAGGVKKAAAALSVGVGHYSDPDSLQGLSHYLEHMLFMGSEKYPNENEYDAFLTAHSGSSNAFTEEESTTYHFDCAPEALKGALDRFAQFFVAPLVKADALEREVKAVDNEFSGVLQSDSCRLSQLRAHTSRAEHPASKFGWGNRKSLVEDPAAAGIDVRAALLEHYKKQYGAERMNLVVLGGQPLETLESWVAEMFSHVPAGRGPRPRYTGCGFPFEGGQLYLVPAVRKEHRLSATFQLPCLETEYRKKAEEYLSHLIGHEGKGSLLAALKARGWATELCAGAADQTSAAWLFDVSVTLTEAGLAAGPGCGLAVIAALFEYLAMLRGAGVQRWAWDEMAGIGQLKWRFLEEEDAADYAAQVAGDMFSYPVEHVLVGQYLHEEYDPGLVRNRHPLLCCNFLGSLEQDCCVRLFGLTSKIYFCLIFCEHHSLFTHGCMQIMKLLGMMNPSTVRLDIQTFAYDACKATLADIAVDGTVQTDEEPWFKIPYAVGKLPDKLVESWDVTSWAEDISFPPKNNYVPTDFSLCCEAVQSMQMDGPAAASTNGDALAAHNGPFPAPPALVTDQPGLRVWHKMDATFRIPRLTALFRVSCREGYVSPRSAAITHLITKLLEDALCQEAYLADVAGLQYALWFEGSQGIDVKVEGFSHKAPLLVELIFRTLAALSFADEDFSRVHEALLRAYTNANMKPLKHATYLRLRTLKATYWDWDAIHQELKTVMPADVRAFLPILLASTHIESLILGNITEQQAKEVGEAARCALGCQGASSAPDRVLRMPPASSLLVRAAAVNSEEDNSAVEVYLQSGGACDPRDRALVDLVDQLIYEPCYDTLRTKEQLGYTVSSGPRLTHGVAGLCVVVQSGTHGPAHLDARVDAFLAEFGKKLVDMEAEEFEKNREALISNKMLKDRNLGDEAERAWDALINRAQDFDARKDEVAALRALTREEVQKFFADTFVPHGAMRRKLAVHVVGKGHAPEVGAAAPQGVTLLEDAEEVKERWGFYPPLTPKTLKKEPC